MKNSRLVIIALAVSIGGCSASSEPDRQSTASYVVGACVRDPAVLGGPEMVCVTDVECPCGSFCDTAVGVCTYACMPADIDLPPPDGEGEWFSGTDATCSAGGVCDDTGRCVGAGSGPPGTAVVLGAEPAVVRTVAGGPEKTFGVTLRLTNPSQADLALSEQTVVRVLGRDGAEVSCDGAAWSGECELTGWTFGLEGTVQEAAQTASVRTVAGTEDSHGDVLLFIDSTRAQFIVSAMAGPALVAEDGLYTGIAVSPDYPGGIPVTARVRQQLIALREPSRTIAPDGALLLDLPQDGQVTHRRMVWLRGLGASDSAGAVVGSYVARAATVDVEAGTMDVPVDFDVPGATGLDGWHLLLTRTAIDPAPECVASSGCSGGEVCATDVQACMPPAVLSPTSAPEGNLYDDARSAAWWSSVQASLTTSPAFATRGADLVESLLCSVDQASPGRLGVAQIKQPGSASRSGDLACIDAAGTPSSSPGAVGVATLADRGPSSDVVSHTVLQTCLLDVARQPPAAGSGFGTYFGVTVGKCVNLARFVPAVRLLATDALGKSTAAELEPRGRGLLVRLVQQWAMLHGLLASTGLSQRDHDSALATIPPAQTRAALLNVLDVLDRGWGALLDRQIQGAIRSAAGWSPGTEGDHSRDYRLLKKPVVYWTFNGAAGDPWHDLIHNVGLVPQGPASSSCQIADSYHSLSQWFDCPGYSAALPAHAPSLVDDPSLGGAGRVDNLTVTLNVDARDTGTWGGIAAATKSAASPGETRGWHCPLDDCDPPPDPEPDPDPPPHPHPRPPPLYRGGTLLATPTLAIAETFDPVTGVRSLVLAHPTASGVELTTFTGYGQLGRTPPIGEGDDFAAGTTIAVVRDAGQKKYTVYFWHSGATQLLELSRTYQLDPAGALDWVPSRTVRLGAPGALPDSHYWTPYERSYPGFIDDVAIFDSALSAREVQRFASSRQDVETRRTVWPADMILGPHGTQEIATPLGALLLETQVAELQVAARLVAAVEDRAQVACDSSQESVAAAARADVDAVVARVGRTVRQSHLIEGLAELDTSERTDQARQLLRARRMEIVRALEPARCTPPFDMAEGEVPLYFNSISPQSSETTAFFAASDHLLVLAQDRAGAAAAALEAARTAYDQARQSEIQQIQSDAARDIRIDAITNEHGEALRRLCGIPDLSNAEIADAIVTPDPDEPFSVETCFVEPTDRCVAQHGGPLADADASCYRGALGATLVDLRAAYFAAQAAHQSWLAAADNAKAAEELCIWKERDAFGHNGTVQLVAAFNDYQREIRESRSVWSRMVDVLSFPLKSGTGPMALVSVVRTTLKFHREDVDAEVLQRKEALDELLLRRTKQGEIAACWVNADQYERAIAAAEDSASQALSRYEAAAIGFDNALAEGRQIVLELPIAIDRELNRPSIPIAFHYWLDERIARYDRLFAIARRYAYLALRAVEYDKQESYVAPVSGNPLRAAVLGASHPDALQAQLELLQARTSNRRINGNLPSLQHITFDLGTKFFGLAISSPLFGNHLKAHLRPVYDTDGRYMGEGVRFSFVPRPDEAPGGRCAERIWRVAVGAVGFPTNDPANMRLKLFKRNSFASRQCGTTGLRAATWRPESNLFVGAGEPGDYQPPTTFTAADVGLERLDVAGALDAFRERDDAYNGSSTELSLQGLYGDYLLLVPKIAIQHGLVPENLRDFNVRFDFLSGENSAQPQSFSIEVDESTDPLLVK